MLDVIVFLGIQEVEKEQLELLAEEPVSTY